MLKYFTAVDDSRTAVDNSQMAMDDSHTAVATAKAAMAFYSFSPFLTLLAATPKTTDEVTLIYFQF